MELHGPGWDIDQVGEVGEVGMIAGEGAEFIDGGTELWVRP